jgi:hypothetical protein
MIITSTPASPTMLTQGKSPIQGIAVSEPPPSERVTPQPDDTESLKMLRSEIVQLEEQLRRQKRENARQARTLRRFKRVLFWLTAIFITLLVVAQLRAAEPFNHQCRTDEGPVAASCTITVFNAGTLDLSSIFSDSGLTMVLPNPFSADADGRFTFYAADGTYDVQMSGGTPAIDTTTISDIALGAGGAHPVSTVFGRTGNVVATSGDYEASEVTNAIRSDTNNLFGAFYHDFQPIAPPGSPATDNVRLYANSDSLWVKMDNGTAIDLASTGATPHALLSVTHSDSLASAVSRGSIVVGNATPAWAEVAIGANLTVLASDGTDAAWTALTDAHIPDGITITLAATASALAANGANCSSGQFSSGVDASGIAEGCTDLLEETELDAESELESQLADVTNVFTDNDTIPDANINGANEADEIDLANLSAKDIDSLTGQSDIDTAFTFDGVKVSFDDGPSEATVELPHSGTTPGACQVGEVYIDENEDVTGSLMICVSTNTWKDVDDDGGGAGAEVNNLEVDGSQAIGDNEVFVGTSTDVGTYIPLATAGMLAFNGTSFNAVDTSLEVYQLITDETGSPGAMVFNASPSLTGTVTLVGSVGDAVFDGGGVELNQTANNSAGPAFTFYKERGGGTTPAQDGDTIGTWALSARSDDLMRPSYITLIGTADDTTGGDEDATLKVFTFAGGSVGQRLAINDSLSLFDAGTRPTCDATQDGKFWYDTTTLDFCLDKGSGYAWSDVVLAEVNNLETSSEDIEDNEVAVGTATDTASYLSIPTAGFLTFNGGTFNGVTTSADVASVITNETGTGALVMGTSPTFTTSAISPAFVSTAADPADGEVVRLGNTECIAWELATPGTDDTLCLNSSDVFAFSAALHVTSGGIGVGISPTSQLQAYRNNTQEASAPALLLEQDGAGDSSLKFLLTGVRSWDFGVDNSDSDSMKMQPIASNAWANTVWELTTDGDLTIEGTFTFGTSGAVLHPPSASEPVNCTTSNDGSMYFDTSDQTMCVCANDGTDEWQQIQDMTTDCSI